MVLRHPSSIVVFLLLILFEACNPDHGVEEEIQEEVQQCVPKSIWSNGDSIAYRYNSNHQLTAVEYYRDKTTLSEKTDLAYSNGRLVTVSETYLGSGSPSHPIRTYTIEYSADGMPSKLTDLELLDPDAIGLVTEFTHDNNKRLTRALTYFSNTLTGGYAYEYNESGNVIRVKYFTRDPSNTNNTIEVLARENMTFDEKSVFYAGSKDLAILNVYVYRHIPNVNNVVTSKIYYTSYNSYLTPPTNINFTVTYDDESNIKSNNAVITYVPRFGDLIFSKATYECF